MQVRFEASPQWPDALPALRAAKTAFLLQLCRALEAYLPGSDPTKQPPNQSKRPRTGEHETGGGPLQAAPKR